MADDTKSCETCNQCTCAHIKIGEEYCRGMLHYCEIRKKIVDKDDKCRMWQKLEWLNSVQDDMDTVLARLKEIYKLG